MIIEDINRLQTISEINAHLISQYSQSHIIFDSVFRIINFIGRVDEHMPPVNASLRTLIRQRRQWALRGTRRNEGPNVTNQRQLNMQVMVESIIEIMTKMEAPLF